MVYGSSPVEQALLQIRTVGLNRPGSNRSKSGHTHFGSFFP